MVARAISPSFLPSFDTVDDRPRCTAADLKPSRRAPASAASSMPAASGITMRHSSEKKPTPVDVDATTVAERVVAFIKRKHPRKTAQCVAIDTKCSVDQVEKWIERASVPNGVAMLRLTAAYGPQFLAEVVPGFAWLDEAALNERQRELELEIEARRAELFALSGRQ